MEQWICALTSAQTWAICIERKQLPMLRIYYIYDIDVVQVTDLAEKIHWMNSHSAF